MRFKSRFLIFLAIFSIVFACKTAQKKSSDENSIDPQVAEENPELRVDNEVPDVVIKDTEIGDYYYEDYEKKLEELRQEEARKRAALEEELEEERLRNLQLAMENKEQGKELADLKKRTEDNLNYPFYGLAKKAGPAEQGDNDITPLDVKLDGVRKAGILGDRTLLAGTVEEIENDLAGASRGNDQGINPLRSNQIETETITPVTQPTIKVSGLMSDVDLQKLYNQFGKPIIVQNRPDQQMLDAMAGMEDTRIFKTTRFGIRRGKRLKSFHTLNGPGKDYHLVQSPITNSNLYYYLTDRIKPVFKSTNNLKATPLSAYRSQVDSDVYQKMKQSIEQKITDDMSGTGFLEIMVCESAFNKDGEKEIFYSPKFTNIKDIHRGNKLGFALFFNEETEKIELIYSAEGDLFLAESSDGVNFDIIEDIFTLNSEFIERDPTISSDGLILAFASSRNFRSNIQGTQLFVSIRDSLDEPWPEPVVVSNAINALSELFPSIYSTGDSSFVFFKVYDKNPTGYMENLYSVEIRNKVVLPMVPFQEDSDIPFKYITVSYSEKRGNRIMSAFPVNDYDLYRMHIEDVESIYVDVDGNIIEELSSKSRTDQKTALK